MAQLRGEGPGSTRGAAAEGLVRALYDRAVGKADPAGLSGWSREDGPTAGCGRCEKEKEETRWPQTPGPALRPHLLKQEAREGEAGEKEPCSVEFALGYLSASPWTCPPAFGAGRGQGQGQTQEY